MALRFLNHAIEKQETGFSSSLLVSAKANGLLQLSVHISTKTVVRKMGRMPTKMHSLKASRERNALWAIPVLKRTRKEDHWCGKKSEKQNI